MVAIAKLQVKGIAVADVLSLGRQPGYSEIFEELVHFPGVEMGMVPKKHLIMFVEDEQVQSIVDTIATVARTGYYGDGRVVVSQVDSIRHIHNGED